MRPVAKIVDKEWYYAPYLAKILDKSVENFYTIYKRDEKIGRSDRFKKINNLLYVNIHYNKMDHEEIEEAQALYFELIDKYSDSNWQLSLAVSELSDISPYAAYNYMRTFKFTNKVVRDKYIKAFKELLGR